MIKSIHTILKKGDIEETFKKVTFDKTNQQSLNLGNSVLNGVRTIQFWIRLTDNVSAEDTIISRFPGGSSTGRVDISFNSGNIIKFLINNSGTNNVITTSKALTVGIWYHITLRIDATEGARLFFQGVKDSTDGSAITSAFASVSTNTYLGGLVGIGSRYTNFEMKELKFWTTARTESEILDDLTDRPISSTTNLRAYWNFYNYSLGSSLDITNTYTATFSTNSGSTDDMVVDTPKTDYYSISLDNNTYNEYIDLSNDSTTDIKVISFNFTPSETLDSSSPIKTIAGNGRSPSNSNGMFLYHRGSTNSGGITVGCIYLLTWDSSGTYRPVFGTSEYILTEGVTYNFTIVKEDSTNTIKVYVDGVLELTITGYTDSFLPSNTTYNYYLGRISENTSSRVSGKFYHVNLWDISLNSSEVNNNISAVFDGTESGLVWHSRQLQGEGSNLVDIEDRNNGTLSSTGSVDDMWILNE